MRSAQAPVLRDLVLLGGGHSHLAVLRRFGMQPEPGVRVTLVSEDSQTPYSGMLPGYVAGHYGEEEIHLDLWRIAACTGARLVRARIVGLDRGARRVLLEDRPPLAYDIVSINTGSAPARAVPGVAEHATAVKPIAGFLARWKALVARVRERGGALTVAVVGGGASGVELALALEHRLRRELRALGRDPAGLTLRLYTREAEILATHGRCARRRLAAILAARGIDVRLRSDIVRLEAGTLVEASGERHRADEILWATQAEGPNWLRGSGLALDEAGFVRVDAALRSVSDPAVFATGDAAAFGPRRLEKSGVYAVRAGRTLAENLRRALRGEPLARWRPQRRTLAILGTGDERAIAVRGAFCVEGRWVWRWKQWLDARFMRRYRHPRLAAPTEPAPSGPVRLALGTDEAAQAAAANAPRCSGCAAKVGPATLGRVLARLDPLRPPEVILGLEAPDDAAVLRVPEGMLLVQSVDFFRVPVEDPWLAGRIAANHALNDLYAMGAKPLAASALVTLPPAPEAKTEELLFQLLAGALRELGAAGCALTGGHSAEGAEVALGFSVNGVAPAAALTTKSALRPGDALVLTKPLGTGVLFAALARASELAFLRGRWIDAAIAAMLRSGGLAARILRDHGVRACTDVSGFGLAGHLLEMLRASGCAARISLDALPALPGVEACLEAGVASSAAPANASARAGLRVAAAAARNVRVGLLFDPQTAGALLAAVSPQRVQACLAALRASGYAEACEIGRVESGQRDPAIEVYA